MWDKIKRLFNVRTWPHPTYGNYGGALARCNSQWLHHETGICPMPVDSIDGAFQKHDEDTGDEDDVFADPKLVYRLVRELPGFFGISGYYDQPVYGRLYHVAALVLFTVMSPFTVPIRGLKKLFKGNT